MTLSALALADTKLGDPARADKLELAEVNRRLQEADPEQVIRWATKAFAPSDNCPTPLVMTSSFGAQSAVLLHLVATAAGRIPVVFLDTGHLFPETYRFAEALKDRLSLDVRVYAPTLTAAHQEALYGRLWEQGPEGVDRYLELNKRQPMQRALLELSPKAWLAGLRKDQTEHRAGLDVVTQQDGHYKIHPILNWSDEDVAAYLEKHELPVHPLVGRGYHSIGDVHSTIPTVPGQHPREGRILGKTQECGIHLTVEENRSLTSSKL